MIQDFKKQNGFNDVFSVVDFSKASPEAINAILTALNYEIDEAVAQKRCPSLDKAFSLLGPTSGLVM